MALAHMQPDAQRHERRSGPEEDRGLLGKQQERERRAEERRHRKVRASPRGAEMAKRDNEEHETYAVPEETDESCGSNGSREWKGAAHHECQREVDRSRDETLEAGDGGSVAPDTSR